MRESGKPEEFAFHQGRNRSKDAVAAFLNAMGTKTHLNHRGLCSAARRAANLTYLFESDWDLGDYANTKYILNFGSNMFEAHQGHVAGAQRVQRGRFENGAKMVTFDVRMSNTAGNSDEFYMPHPGTDGAVALAMAHVIVGEGLYDETFFSTWANCTIDELKEQLAEYTPEWAERVSTVDAAVIARIAREFAAAAPHATTMCNRGSSAHMNGYYNDRAIGLLNVLCGSVGKPGGWCWMFTGGVDTKRFKPPKAAPKPKVTSLLADPPEIALANVWNTMKVGELVYWYLQQERARIQVYMTYNLDSPLTWPEQDVTRNVLLDEDKIGYHVCINPFLNETATFADMVLPWATFMERWDVDARGAYNLKPYISMRRPMVAPLGEAKDVREIFPELARRVGGEVAKYYPERSIEDYMAEYVKDVPYDEQRYDSAFEFLEDQGAWEDPKQKPYFEPYLQPLSEADLAGSETDPETGIITKDGKGHRHPRRRPGAARLQDTQPQARGALGVRRHDGPQRGHLGADRAGELQGQEPPRQPQGQRRRDPRVAAVSPDRRARGPRGRPADHDVVQVERAQPRPHGEPQVAQRDRPQQPGVAAPRHGGAARPAGRRLDRADGLPQQDARQDLAAARPRQRGDLAQAAHPDRHHQGGPPAGDRDQQLAGPHRLHQRRAGQAVARPGRRGRGHERHRDEGRRLGAQHVVGGPLGRRPVQVGAQHRQRLGPERGAADQPRSDLGPAGVQRHRRAGAEALVSEQLRDDAALRAPARLFAALLLRELDAAALEELRRPEIRAALAALSVSLPDEADLPTLASDFFAQVLQPANTPPLVQSLWAEGKFDGDAAVAVRSYAEAAGLELAEAARNAPVDHLGCLLTLWAELHEREPDAAARFARQHLAWVAGSTASRAQGDRFYDQVQRATAALCVEIVAGAETNS